MQVAIESGIDVKRLRKPAVGNWQSVGEFWSFKEARVPEASTTGDVLTNAIAEPPKLLPSANPVAPEPSPVPTAAAPAVALAAAAGEQPAADASAAAVGAVEAPAPTAAVTEGVAVEAARGRLRARGGGDGPSPGQPAPIKTEPWQCLQFDEGHGGDAWCGKEKIRYAGGDLKVVHTMGKNQNYPGCGACWCCMESWPAPSWEDLLRTGAVAEDDPLAIQRSANETFHHLLRFHRRRRPRLEVASVAELRQLRAALRHAKDQSKAVLGDDLTLGSGKVRRFHRLLSLRPLGGRGDGDGDGAAGGLGGATLVDAITGAQDLPSSFEGGGYVAEFSALPVHCPTSLLDLFPAFSATLKQKALARAVDNRVVFTMTDKTYQEAMPCWRWSVEALTGAANTLIIPTDTQTMDVCRTHKLPCVMVNLSEQPRINLWGHIGFLKFYSMALLSSVGLDFIFTEMDVIILQNPWPYHEREDKLQWKGGDCRHFPHDMPGRAPTRENVRAELADIQVTSHFNNPRVNIGYIYARSTPQTMNFFWLLFAYFTGMCADPVLGYDRRPNTFVDLGLPDQNIFDAFLRNHDFNHPKYNNIPWEKLPPMQWKLLDYNLFGIYGRNEARQRSWVTFHYAGEGRKVFCWRGICEKMRKMQKEEQGGLPVDGCIKPWAHAPCRKPEAGEAPSLQGAIGDACLGVHIDCSRLR